MQAIFKSIDISLEKFGYILGRLIYILDVYDDMDEDYKGKKYNPALLQYKYNGTVTEEIIKNISDNLYYSLGELSKEYETLKIKKNKQIIDNIIYLGLRAKCDVIIERKKQNEKPL